jgi:predicted nucleic acid-binding protein
VSSYRTILLDSGPLGLVTNPKVSSETLECARWVQSLIANSHRVLVPEIADYEVRRELIRAGKRAGLNRLDALNGRLEYLPLTTEAMRLAAQLWAEARQHGYPNAPDSALDGDVILAAQALALNVEDLVIATTNLKHITRFIAANHWQSILP